MIRASGKLELELEDDLQLLELETLDLELLEQDEEELLLQEDDEDDPAVEALKVPIPATQAPDAAKVGL